MSLFPKIKTIVITKYMAPTNWIDDLHNSMGESNKLRFPKNILAPKEDNPDNVSK